MNDAIKRAMNVARVERASDSWEQLESDVVKTTCEYFGRSKVSGCNKGCHGYIEGVTCSYVKELDMLYRAEKLAGVE